MFWKTKKDISPTIAEVAKSFANGAREFSLCTLCDYDGVYEREDGVKVLYLPPDNYENFQTNDGTIRVTFPTPYGCDQYTKAKVVTFGDNATYPLTRDERQAIHKAFETRSRLLKEHQDEEREKILDLIHGRK